MVATVIHDGHELRPEIAELMALGEGDRRREEDPFTGEAVRGVARHIIVHRSRFEFDLNRDGDEFTDVFWGRVQRWRSEQAASPWPPPAPASAP